MDKKIVDTQAALQFGWNTLKENFVFFIKLLLILIVASVLPAWIFGKIGASGGVYVRVPLQFLLFVWQAILGMGVLKICLKLHDKEAVAVSDLWSCLPLTLDYVVTKFLYTLLVTIGLILLIIPGLIWAIQFYMASYLIVDQNPGPINALKQSSALTKGLKWDLGIFATILAVVNLLGALCLGIGLMITLPITMLANVYVYRQVLNRNA